MEKIRVRATRTSGGREVLLVLSEDTLTCSDGRASGRTLFSLPLEKLDIRRRVQWDGRRFVRYALYLLLPGFVLMLAAGFTTRGGKPEHALTNLAVAFFVLALVGSLVSPGVFFSGDDRQSSSSRKLTTATGASWRYGPIPQTLRSWMIWLPRSVVR